MQTKSHRLLSLDMLRALAVILMIIFHFTFDLDIFGFVDVDFLSDPFWWFLPRLIVFLFLLAVGASFSAVAQRGLLSGKKMLIRFLKLSSLALLISIFTYFAFRPSWIYFGTLHCIALCSLLAWPLLLLPLKKRVLLCLAITLTLWIPLALYGHEWPWIKLEHPSMDYIPVLPWFGIVTLGMFLFDMGLFERCERAFGSFFQMGFFKPIHWLGRYSLEVYLIHQPLLYGSTWLAYLLIK